MINSKNQEFMLKYGPMTDDEAIHHINNSLGFLIAKRKSLSDKVIRHLITKRLNGISTLLSNHELSSDQLDLMVHGMQSHHVAGGEYNGVHKQKNFSEVAIHRLVTSESANIRSVAAEIPNLPKKYHEQLVKDDSDVVRSYMAYRSDISNEHHALLRNDITAYVRHTAALNSTYDNHST